MLKCKDFCRKRCPATEQWACISTVNLIRSYWRNRKADYTAEIEHYAAHVPDDCPYYLEQFFENQEILQTEIV